MGMAVEDGDDGRPALGREELVEDGQVALAEPLPGLDGAQDEVRRGQADHVDGEARAREGVGGGEHLGHHRPDPTRASTGAPSAARRR